MSLVGDSELAVAESVPELDGTVAGTGDDLTVVGREGDGEDVIGVANEATSSLTSAQFPKAQSLVPGRRERVGTVGRDDAVADDVGMAVEAALGITVGAIVAGEIPDDEGLVTGA